MTPRQRQFLLLILALFASLRLIHLAQLVDSPALVQHQWPDSDMFAFWHWSDNIAAGDLLSRQPQRPPTSWHIDVAHTYLRLAPWDPASKLTDNQAVQTLWQRWQGGAQFYQEPLYPYLLAPLRLLQLPILLVFLAQMLLGLLGLWLLIDATRRLLGPREALLAGLLATLCGPLAYYESLLLRETLAITLMWLLLRQWSLARARVDVRIWASVGLCAGLCLLTRAAILPFVLILLLFSLRQSWRSRLLGWLLGLSLPLGLLILRNVLVQAPPFALAGGGIFAILAANLPGADPWQGLILDPAQLAQLLAGADNRPLRLLHHAWLQWPHPGPLLALQLRKIAVLLHNHEIPNNASFLFYRQHAPILKLLPVSFGIALPFGLLGMLHAVRQRRGLVLVLLALVQTLPLLILQPLSRYRLPLLAVLLPLMALALVTLWDQARQHRPKQWIPALLLTLSLLVFLYRPLPRIVPPTRAVDHLVAWQFWTLPRMQRAMAQQNSPELIETFQLFLRGEPTDLLFWPPELRDDQRKIARVYADAHGILAQVLEQQKEMADAQLQRNLAEKLKQLANQQGE